MKCGWSGVFPPIHPESYFRAVGENADLWFRRLAGADRYGTSAAASTYTFGTRVPVAYVATGTNFPDALGGGPVAGSIPGPLLLVPGTSVPSDVASELRRLSPERVVLLGGTSVVSASVQAQIETLLGR